MLKYSIELHDNGVIPVIDQFLAEQEYICWAVEEDALSHSFYLCGYVASQAQGDEELSNISNHLKINLTPIITTVPNNDWTVAYRESAMPWQCENLHWIPLWMKDSINLPKDAVGIYIEPGMAFGTGSHETTQLCARSLVMFCNLYKKTEDLVIKDCIDVGCGSGILGISAIKLGMSHATLLDIDPDAVRIAEENAKLNGIFHEQVDFVVGDLKTNLLGRQADLLLVNILSNVLLDNAELLVKSVRPGGMLSLSGILTTERSTVHKAFEQQIEKHWKSHIETFGDIGEWTVLTYFRG